MDKAVTIKDIAKILNISPTTVSKALKDYPDISKKTKEKVINLAKELNYTPNMLAQNLRSQSSHIIGLIIPEIVHHFFSQVISAISEYAEQKGYMVIVLQSNESSEVEKKQIELLKRFKVDGLLISLANDSDNQEILKNLQDSGVPIVMFDKLNPNFSCSKVNIDDYHAAYQATEYLIDKGYSKIAHIGGPKKPRNAVDRVKGYRDAIIKSGKNFDEKLIYRTADSNLEEGYSAMNTLLAQHKGINAVFCVSDMIAMGAMQALHEKNIKIPDEVAVMGFSNWFMCTVSKPTLSTVNQSGEAIGLAAAEQLIREIEIDESLGFQKIIIPTTLIIRESTK